MSETLASRYDDLQSLLSARKGFLRPGDRDLLAPNVASVIDRFVDDFGGGDNERVYEARFVRALALAMATDREPGAAARSFIEACQLFTRIPVAKRRAAHMESLFRSLVRTEEARLRDLHERRIHLGEQAEQASLIAQMSQPALWASPQMRREMAAQSHNFLSDAAKYRAFSQVASRMPTTEKLRAAVAEFDTAIKHAHAAQRAFEEISTKKAERHKDTVCYLKYWRSVFAARVAVMDRCYSDAESAIAAAQEDAAWFAGRTEKIFPNYFFNPEDLANELLVIESIRLADERGDFASAALALDQWLERSRPTLGGAWRFNQVDLRQRVLSLLASMPTIRMPADESDRIAHGIERLLDSVFVGKASLLLAETAIDLARQIARGHVDANGDVYVRGIRHVIDLLPISSTVAETPPLAKARRRDCFAYLPRQFTILSSPAVFEGRSESELARLRMQLRQLVTAYLALMLDYHQQRYADFRSRDMTNVGEASAHALESPLTVDDVPEVLRASNDLPQTLDGLRTLQTLIRERLLRPTWRRFFPHFVRIAAAPDAEGRTILESFRPDPSNRFVSVIGDVAPNADCAYGLMSPRFKLIELPTIFSRSSEFVLSPCRRPHALIDPLRAAAAALEQRLRALPVGDRSEERRVGKECRSRWSP